MFPGGRLGPEVSTVQERPAYLLVADELRRQIQLGDYPAGARLPTMEELRRFYGVSEIVIRHAVSRGAGGVPSHRDPGRPGSA